ncbi:MAG: DUF389 domain-containing protein [Kiloniellales bacterium]|nr:DUF389 domain-containing protein [Kiloniellales bacterium]
MSRSSTQVRRLWVPLKRTAWRFTAGWRPYLEDHVPAEDLTFLMYKNAIPSLGFFLMLGLSGTIATLGLFADSAPAIIGAMIIAPLMAPIVSAAFGIACADRKLIVLSMLTVVAGSLVVVAIAYLGVEFFGVRIAGSEILARTSPSYLDFGVALAAGCAGAFAQTRPSIANSIAGVAIAVALVPPLAVTGIGLSLGSKATTETGLSLSEFGLYSGGADIAAGAFLLFIANFIGILLVAALVFVAQRYGNWQKALLLVVGIAIGSFMLMPALGGALHEIYVENRVVRLFVKGASQDADAFSNMAMAKIDRIHVSYRVGVLYVTIDMFASRENLEDAQARLDEFRRIVEQDIGEPVVIEVDVVPIEILQFRSAPSLPE